MALNASEPTSIRLAQLRILHGQAYALDVASDAATQSPHWPDLLASASTWLGAFRSLAALPPTTYRLPMEAGAPDFAWGDVQAGAVAVKHDAGGVRVYASMQWRHGYTNRKSHRVPANVALNNVARVHMTVTDGTHGGSSDHVMNVNMQEMAGPNAGWAKLYATDPVGNLTIAMNGAATTTLTWPVKPPSPHPSPLAPPPFFSSEMVREIVICEMSVLGAKPPRMKNKTINEYLYV